MTQPIVFVTTHGIREGKLHEFKEMNREAAEALREGKPGTVAFLTYLSEDGGEATFVHVFPDAQAMDAHMEGVSERTARAADLLEFRRFEVYGRPSDRVIEALRQSTGTSLVVRPEYVSGYLRLAGDPGSAPFNGLE